MSSFEPNKRHLQDILIYFFNLKKSAAEAHRLFVETYGEAALNERTFHEWFQKFDGEYDIDDKELAHTLGVTQKAISHRLKSLGMIKKQGNWITYELTPKNVERRIST